MLQYYYKTLFETANLYFVRLITQKSQEASEQQTEWTLFVIIV